MFLILQILRVYIGIMAYLGSLRYLPIGPCFKLLMIFLIGLILFDHIGLCLFKLFVANTKSKRL